MTLFQSKTFQNSPSKNFHSIVKLLSDMEIEWFDKQKQFSTAKSLEKIKKGKNQSLCTQKCPQLCKGWNEPATSIDELRDFKSKLQEVRKDHYIFGIPIKLTQYNRLTCSRWIKFHTRNNFLLSEYNPMSNYVTLPSNADTLNLLPSSPISCIENENSVQIVENYVTLLVEGNTNTWYIATCTKKNEDDTYEMDHLQKMIICPDLNWKHPAKVIINQSQLLSVISMVSGKCQ